MLYNKNADDMYFTELDLNVITDSVMKEGLSAIPESFKEDETVTSKDVAMIMAGFKFGVNMIKSMMYKFSEDAANKIGVERTSKVKKMEDKPEVQAEELPPEIDPTNTNGPIVDVSEEEIKAASAEPAATEPTAPNRPVQTIDL